MIETAIRTILTGDATVAGLVSTRVYIAALPQEPTLPAVWFWRVATPERLITHSGSVTIAEPLFQINCTAETPEEALSLADAVKDALRDYSGTEAGTVIYYTKLGNETLIPPNENLENYHVPIGVVFAHRE